MIKGKKIEAVNLQLLSMSKNVAKQGGFAIGKEFMLEKRQFLGVVDRRDNLNEQDLHIVGHQELSDKLEHSATHIATVQPPQTQQIQNKCAPNTIECMKKQGSKVIKSEKEGKERQQNKKQNKMMNTKSSKQMKVDLKKDQVNRKITKIQQKKPISVESKPKRFKAPVPIVPKQTLNKIIDKNAAQSMNQKNTDKVYEQIKFQQQIEQQRIKIPNPIVDIRIQPTKDYLQQISFGNYQNQIRLPLNPIKYQSSDEEDFRQPDNVFCITQDDQSKNEEDGGDGGLGLNSELFELTAEQLLAKEYFNV